MGSPYPAQCLIPDLRPSSLINEQSSYPAANLWCDGVVVVGIDACEFISGLTGNDAAVFPGELVLLSEFAADPELEFEIPKQNAKHLTLFCELADDAESVLDADAEFDVSPGIT
jgi:hypothetical protein